MQAYSHSQTQCSRGADWFQFPVLLEQVVFRNVHMLLMDTATTEYLFCCDFFGENTVFKELFFPIISVVENDFNDAVQVITLLHSYVPV